MSRQQWGHGYYKGREDERKNPERFRYLGRYDSEDDPYLNSVAMVREHRPDKLVVEWLYYIDVLLAIAGGYEMAIDPYNPDAIEEIDISSLTSEYRKFYTWEAVVSEMIKAEKFYKARATQ